MRHFVKRFSLILAAILLLVITFIIFLQTTAAKTRISRYIKNYLQREFQLKAEIGSLDYQFIPLEVEIRDFIVYGKQPGKFAEARSLVFEIPYSAVWSRNLHIRKLTADISFLDFKNVPEPSLKKLTELRLQIDRAAIHGNSFRYAKLTLNDIAILAKAGPGEIRLEQLRAKMGSANLRASGSFRSRNGEVDLRYEVEGDVREVSSLVAKGISLQGNIRSSGEVTGKDGTYSVSGDLIGKSLFLKRSPPFTVAGKYSVLPADQYAPLKVDLQWESLSLATVQSGVPFRIGAWSGGSLHFSGGADFRKAKGSFRAHLSPDRKEDLQLRGEVEGSFVEGTIRLQPTALYWIKGNHTYSTRIESAVFNLPNSEGLIKCHSSFGLFIANLKLRNKSLLLDASITRSGITATIEKGILALANRRLVADLQGSLPEGSYQIAGFLPLDPDAEMNFRASLETDIKAISLIFPEAKGQGMMHGSFEVNGTKAHPVFSGNIDSENFELNIKNRFEIQRGSFAGAINGKEIFVTTNGSLYGSQVSLDALIPLQNRPGRIHFAAPSVALASLDSSFRGLASISLDAVGRGIQLTGWEGTASLTATEVAWRKLPIQIPNELQLSLSRGILTLGEARLAVGNFLNLAGKGRFNLRDGSVNAALRSSVDLQVLPMFLPNTEASGQFSSLIQIGGTITSPDLRGDIELERAWLRSSALPVAIEDATFHATLNRQRLSSHDFSARVAGGSLGGGGEIDLHGWTASTYRFWIRARDVGFNYPEDFRSQISADLDFSSLSSPKEMPLLSGAIVLSHSIITRNVDNKLRLLTTLLLDKIAFTSSEIRLPMKLQLRFENKDPILISNNLGNLQAGIQLLVQGDASNPRLQGHIRVSPEGRLYLQTRRFFVERGNIMLDGYGKVVPRLDLILSTRIQDDKSKEFYDVKLPISGPMDNLEDLSPKSYPPLQPEQIYFLLLTGRTEAQLTQAESRFMRQQLLAYYSGQMVLPVPEKIPQDPSLSSVEIHPELISSERDPAGRAINGKDLFSGISIVYSVPLTRADEQTWIANYRFRKNVAVRFIDQEDGTYSSNLQQNFRFGGRVEKTPMRLETKQAALKIARADIRNNSPLTEAELQEILQLQEGQPYDYWQVHEKLFDLKARLQKVGFLFPSAVLEKTETVGGAVRLQISVNARGLRRMIFKGYDPEQKKVEKYERWWREEFAEDAILGMIRQDLLAHLWLKGYHRAEVSVLRSGKDGDLHYVFESATGIKFQVNLDLEGPQAVDARELEKQLEEISESRKQLESDALHDFSSLRAKLQLVYLKEGFLDAVVREGRAEVLKDQSKIQKKVEIREGPISKIHSITVSRKQHFPSDLISDLKLRVGEVYDSLSVTEDELTIARYYEKRGYRNVQVKGSVRRNSAGLELVYDLKTGGIARIHQIVLHGNQRTNSKVIQNLLPFKTGDPLVQEQLAEGQKRLYDMKLFSQVQLRADATGVPDRYVVVIDLVERGNYELTYSAGFNTEKKLEGILQISDLNLFGRGHSISLLSKFNSEDRIARLIYHVPDSVGLKWKTLISAFYEQLEQPLFITNTRGIELQHQLRFIDPLVFVADYRFDRVEVTEKDPTDIYYIGEAPVNVSRLGGVILTDTRNDPLLPTKGTFLSIQTSGASSFLGSQISFVKNYSQLYHYHSFGKAVWASGFRIGLAKPFGNDLIATERFFAGGSFSVRGFEKDRIGPQDPVWGRPMGGEAVFIINQELRFPLPIHEWLYGAVFYDAGNVYDRVSNFDPFRLRHSAGLGLRFQTPVGVGRFDWGINLHRQGDEKRSVFHVALGHAF